MDCIWLVVWLLATLLFSAGAYEFAPMLKMNSKVASSVVVVVSLIALIIVGSASLKEAFKISGKEKEDMEKKVADKVAEAKRMKRDQEAALDAMKKKKVADEKAKALAKAKAAIGKK